MATGSEKDEQKPVRCGCGGEAFVSINGFIEYHVVCALCGMRTDWFRSKNKAIEVWNRAMGIAEKSSTIERTAKVKVRYCVGYCECGQAVNTYSTYCHKCGARLDWSENEQ